MIFSQYAILLILSSTLLLVYFLVKKKYPNFKKDLFFKIISVILLIVFFFRYMLGEDLIQNTVSLVNTIFDNSFYNFTSLILNWFLNAITLLIILSPFFKNKTVLNIIRFFALPTLILCTIALPLLSIGIVGQEAYYAFDFVALLMSAEIAIGLAYSVIVFFENGRFKITKNEAIKLLYIIPMLLAIMPAYMIQALFGYANLAIKIKSFTLPHRMILYLSFLIPVAIYFFLRKKSVEDIRLALLYICLGTLISFSLWHKLATFADITAWPFHLCNTAMYIVPLCLIFKWEKLFYFTLFINVLGAFFAMAMPNYSSDLNLFDSSLVNFYINHYIAFFMPILIIALKVYKRAKLRQFIYSMVAFGIYFLLVLILNAWFSNYGSVDYFFLNTDFVAEKLGIWAENLRDITISFNIGSLNFVFYPIYQVLFFITYIALGLGMWFLYEWSYVGADTLYDISDRKRKMKLDKLALIEKLNGRSIEEPMNLENVNKIELKNFSKKYGRSKNFAVENANLVINGGEIFGFLGPNGAGKSTIIKSIVGIQPITSGTIEVCGYDVDKQSVMAKRNIGFVPDHYALYERLTGREFINYIADLYDVSEDDRTKRINKYVKLLSLEDSFDSQIKTYSHGMKQKITIISALVHNPKVWILDEPLTGLDPTSIFQVKECMKDHAKQGNIVFFSSHIIDVVERICHRIAIIKKGKILRCEKVCDIEKESSLEQFYLDTIGAKNVVKKGK